MVPKILQTPPQDAYDSGLGEFNYATFLFDGFSLKLERSDQFHHTGLSFEKLIN